jgi:hypothetical protein
MRQLGHTDPAFTLRVYTHGMARSPEERARLAALVQGEWTSSASEPPVPPRQLHTRDYEAPIISALQQLGGSASRREVTKAVQAELRSRMTPLDRERLPSGMPRWITRLSKARANLIRDGVLRADTPRGIWELKLDSSEPNGTQTVLEPSSTVSA